VSDAEREGEHGDEHQVTPLELFFDLVFVFAITQVTKLLTNDPSLGWPPARDARPRRHAVGYGLAQFRADALIVSVHPPDVANWRERRLTEEALERFGLSVTEVVIDRDSRVLSVSAD
jgi:Bacterial low temperature requirement A protein (LtrA)